MCTDCYTCAWSGGLCLAGMYDDDYCQAKLSVLVNRLFDVDYYYGVRSILLCLRRYYVR